MTSWISISLVPASTACASVVPSLTCWIRRAGIYGRILNRDATRIDRRAKALTVSVALAHLGMTDDSATLINIGGRSVLRFVEILVEG
jgi:hypothetical protein